MCPNTLSKRKSCCEEGKLRALAWAIAHPARVRIVRLLISRNTCVCGKIVDEMPLAQSTVSQHLKILKESGLVQGEVDGPRVCYCINPQKKARGAKITGGSTAGVFLHIHIVVRRFAMALFCGTGGQHGVNYRNG